MGTQGSFLSSACEAVSHGKNLLVSDNHGHLGFSSSEVFVKQWVMG